MIQRIILQESRRDTDVHLQIEYHSQNDPAPRRLCNLQVTKEGIQVTPPHAKVPAGIINWQQLAKIAGKIDRLEQVEAALDLLRST